MNIYLIGFMGAFKTTAGRICAKEMQRPFIDLDERIVSVSGMPIVEIFRAQGEEAFRALETKALYEASQNHNAVIALGGGAPMREENRRIMQQGCVIFLDAPFAILFSRISKDPARPLVKDEKSTRELFDSRIGMYERICHGTVDASKSAELTARGIMDAYKAFCKQ